MSKLYVVGIGPGKVEGMTYEAAWALQESDVIVGYTVYVDLVKAETDTPTLTLDQRLWTVFHHAYHTHDIQ